MPPESPIPDHHRLMREERDTFALLRMAGREHRVRLSTGNSSLRTLSNAIVVRNPLIAHYAILTLSSYSENNRAVEFFVADFILESRFYIIGQRHLLTFTEDKCEE